MPEEQTADARIRKEADELSGGMQTGLSFQSELTLAFFDEHHKATEREALEGKPEGSLGGFQARTFTIKQNVIRILQAIAEHGLEEVPDTSAKPALMEVSPTMLAKLLNAPGSLPRDTTLCAFVERHRDVLEAAGERKLREINAGTEAAVLEERWKTLMANQRDGLA